MSTIDSPKVRMPLPTTYSVKTDWILLFDPDDNSDGRCYGPYTDKQKDDLVDRAAVRGDKITPTMFKDIVGGKPGISNVIPMADIYTKG